MKILDISAISNTSQMPVKKGTIQFLQDSHKETTAAAWQALIGPLYSPSVLYVMSGGVNTGIAPNYIITGGAVFFNGEVYNFDAVSFTASGNNTAIFNLVVTQFTTDADPVTFTDKTVRNIHNIRKLQVTQGASGSGLSDLMQAYYLNFTIPAQVNLTGTGAVTVTGNYPNIEINVPKAGNLNPVLYAGTFNIGDVPGSNSGGGVYTVPFLAALATASYYVMGTIISNGTPANDSILTFSIHNRTASGFQLNVQEFTTGIQNVAFEYLIFAK